MRNKKLFWLVLAAVVIKIAFFLFAALHAPQAKFQIDTEWYVDSAHGIVKYGTFAREDEGRPQLEAFRTPGYPLFLALFHVLWGIPANGIIILQILLALLTAWITYRAAAAIHPHLGFLSAVIILFDPTITIFSLVLLTETLCLFLMSLFLWHFILYLQNKRMKRLVLSALFLVLATYTRPITLYLGGAVGIFIFYAWVRTKDLQKAVIHTAAFLIIVYSCLGAWQFRNSIHSGYNTFSTITITTTDSDIGEGLYKKYSRSQHGPTPPTQSPFFYYLDAGTNSFLSLMTLPGNFKYFGSKIFTAIGKTLEYPWIVFWMIGFLAGLTKIRGDMLLQFLVLVVGYFIVASVVGSG